MATLESQLTLPKDFRLQDFLEFHQRDQQMIAEIITDKQLQKGFCWNGMPCLLQLDFSKRRVDVQLHLDNGRKKIPVDKMLLQLQQQVKHMLGLNQNVEDFEKQFSHSIQLGKLIAQNTGLRVPQSATPFEALSWAITGQQISVKAAVSLRRKLILCRGVQHSSGIWCYPDASHLANTTENLLRENGFSQTKATTLINLAQHIVSGALPLNAWLENYWQQGTLDAENIYNSLIQLRGIGPWTINYALLRGFGWLDGSLHGDVAVRNRLQQLLNINTKPDDETTRLWLKEFSPWRALVAAHLWHSSPAS